MAMLRCLLLLFCSGMLVSVHAADVSEVSRLARSGATGLALGLMDRHQPAMEEDPVAWMRWERERLFLYRSRGQWEALDARVGEYPDNVHREFSRWARTERARALLELDRPGQAREVLRGLIWSDGVSSERIREWRRMVVESHLEAGEPGPARTALRRFRQDYDDEEGETRVMEARLYLQENNGYDALRILQELPADEQRPLRLSALLVAEPESAGDVLNQAIQLGLDREASMSDRRMAWAVASQAARLTGNRSARIGALEQGLGHRDGHGRLDPMFQLDPDTLWSAYREYGERLGNEARILVGDDPMWFELAEEALGNDRIQARALLSVIAFDSFESEARERAHGMLADSLARERQGSALLYQLYLESRQFPGVDRLPQPVRYRLADMAMDEADIPLASQLMSGLTEPPEGADPEEWNLRRARVLLLGGERAEGLLALETVLEVSESLDVDRFLQVLFDLQNMGDHEPAFDMLNRLLEYELSDQQHREILFWAAESAEGMGDHLEAARLYLRSAGFLDAFSMDQWAQTARYRAADALAEAGLAEDARRLYQSLLNATEDEARRSVLRNRIQRLQTRPVSETVLEGER